MILYFSPKVPSIGIPRAVLGKQNHNCTQLAEKTLARNKTNRNAKARFTQ
jgi:hypothetical protein